MKKYGLQIIILILCVLQTLSFITIVELRKDITNTGSYLSEKIDNVTSKVNMLSDKMK